MVTLEEYSTIRDDICILNRIFINGNFYCITLYETCNIDVTNYIIQVIIAMF